MKMFENLKKWYRGENRTEIGYGALRLLEDEAFLTAKESLQESLLQEFISTKAEDISKREDIYKSYLLIDYITQELAKLTHRNDNIDNIEE